MISLLQGCVIAFSMYSAIPVPIFEWNEKNMRYALVFFPWVGGVIGLGLWGWFWLCAKLCLSGGLFAAGCLLLPILITGGIHLDGFCDSCDALSSHREKEEKLRILKDSHIGAFALICCGVLLFAQYGLFCQLWEDSALVGVVSLGFLLSRCLSGLGVVLFPKAKGTGLASTFSRQADRRCTVAALVIQAALAAAAMVWVSPFGGTSATVCSLLWMWHYFRMSKRQFGGITGDLAGYFLQGCELIVLAVSVIFGVAGRLLK